MKRKLVAFDLDGIVSNFDYAFSKIANRLFGTPILKDPNEVSHWNWNYEVDGKPWYLPQKAIDDVWKEVINTENFWLKCIQPYNEFYLFNIADLQDTGHTIYFITSRPQTKGMSVADQTYLWLLKHCSKLNPHVIITSQKGKILDALKINYYIDDKAANIWDSLKNSPHTKPFLLRRKHNEIFIKITPSYFNHNQAGIVDSIKEFIDTIIEESK